MLQWVNKNGFYQRDFPSDPERLSKITVYRETNTLFAIQTYVLKDFMVIKVPLGIQYNHENRKKQ